MDTVKDSTVKLALAVALAAMLVFFVAGMYVQQGCHKCSPCPEIRDSVVHTPACTVLVDSSKIKIRDSVAVRYDTQTVADTVPVVVEITDTVNVAEIPDTVMSDGAKIGASVRAKLIIPPVSAAIRYTPPPDSLKKLYYYDTTYIPKASWKGTVTGTLGGFVAGVIFMALSGR